MTMQADTEGSPSGTLVLVDPESGTFSSANPDEPQILVTDLAPTRGDGIFEVADVRAGAPVRLEAHLARFARSAAAMDLPLPDPQTWTCAVLQAVSEFTVRNGDDQPAAVKLVLSRGPEEAERTFGWVYVWPVHSYVGVHADGLAVVLLDRGLRSDVMATSPWLLAGVKTLSYAINRAAAREAARRGADDLVFVTSDGYLLEGHNSTLVVRRGWELVTTPASAGVLPGTAQRELFAQAKEWGFITQEALLTPADLLAADAAWLVSSVRGAAPIRTVDGRAIGWDPERTAQFNEALSVPQR